MSLPRMPQRTSQAGFTLAETLVALFILAIVSSAGAALLIGATTTTVVPDRARTLPRPALRRRCWATVAAAVAAAQ